ncbi:hypothetical protein DINM_000796 [Dirofilaria immitis]|nr:hypothetical protein [Dirofilaria immitis]
MTKLANLNDNHSRRSIERLCNNPRATADIRNQQYANIISNSSNTYNAICRRQMLNKLDRLIAQKMITLQEIHMIKSANLNDQMKNSKKKIERLCRTTDQSNRSYKSNLVNMKLPIDKNIATNSILNDNWLLAKSKNENLTQKLDNNNDNNNHNNDKNIINNYSINSSKLTSPTATISEYTSNSTARKSIGKFKKDSTIETRRSSSYATIESDLEISSNNSKQRSLSRTTSENGLETSSYNDSDIKSDDNNNNNNNSNTDNGNNTNSTARTVSSEFSSEASTVTEL